jgi:hypothetical protein
MHRGKKAPPIDEPISDSEAADSEKKRSNYVFTKLQTAKLVACRISSDTEFAKSLEGNSMDQKKIWKSIASELKNDEECNNSKGPADHDRCRKKWENIETGYRVRSFPCFCAFSLLRIRFFVQRAFASARSGDCEMDWPPAHKNLPVSTMKIAEIYFSKRKDINPDVLISSASAARMSFVCLFGCVLVCVVCVVRCAWCGARMVCLVWYGVCGVLMVWCGVRMVWYGLVWCGVVCVWCACEA